ncbi:phosphopantetheine-binding protein [Tsukamurella sp. 8F]|uniref:phosphopantetheine-binding protein n=1 Tax=unclassified Tsukamurella TaxID=2633480 RepID=UPI0023B907C6|nr:MULTISPECIES: phosphopantetheine-binding protein [unclassified Tsukamurella]MDF0531177.1 phosphopantetheine-binding protein [Tsukamurella sp. 8J]MDF0585876.1 phosphopantetheine-binding protein [Tsukamurella sp. 8F]
MSDDTGSAIDALDAAEFPLTRESVVADIAEVLGVERQAVTGGTDLIDHGLDSIRTMYLVEKWQALGVDIQFFDLVDDSTVDGWWRALEAKMKDGGGES